MDVDPDNPTRVLSRIMNPVLDIGRPGTFDGDGVLCTSVRDEGMGSLRMLYAGFEKNTHGTYRLLTGSSMSHDAGDSFVRDSGLPLLERQAGEESVRGAAVFAPGWCSAKTGLTEIVYAGGSDWRTTSDGQLRPVYSLRSISGDIAQRLHFDKAEVLLEPRSGEHGFGRPCFLEASKRLVLISVRLVATSSYRLEVAQIAHDGKWARIPSGISLNWDDRVLDGNGLMFAGSVTTPAGTWVFLNGSEYGRAGVLVTRMLGW